MALMVNVRRLHIGDHYRLHQMNFRLNNKTHLQPIKPRFSGLNNVF